MERRKQVVIWSGSRLHGDLLRTKILIVIWSYFRLHSDLLGNMKLTAIWSILGFVVIVGIELLFGRVQASVILRN